jgi:chaperone BCS1
MDNKLGILLYGPPGTGKTGTITAIANFLKRDVVSINFSEITTCKQFDDILSYSNNKQNIIIFDEFDCILDAVLDNSHLQKKKVVTEEPAKMNWGELLAAAEGEERKKILDMIRENKKVKPEEPINLGYLLSKLDGLESNEDRIIIATTNNPDKINPVLLRPGRFDLKLCLGNCSTKMYQNILTNFFQLTKEQSEKINWLALPEKKYSPLVVINTALTCQDIQKTIEELP